MTAAHEEKETLSVEVEIPGHADRGSATELFIRTKKIPSAVDLAEVLPGWLQDV